MEYEELILILDLKADRFSVLSDCVYTIVELEFVYLDAYVSSVETSAAISDWPTSVFFGLGF